MKKKITFLGLLVNWFVVTLILGLINMFLIKSSILHNLILASLGIILLIYPVYPQNLENKWTPKKCRLFIRILAVIEIILAFATRTNFYKDDYVTVYSTTIVTTNTNSAQTAFQIGSIVLIVAVIAGIFIWIRKRK
ncbi:MAG: hypothetical protein J6B23_02355 [Clostridia bacterium]|nr:hypothetical protein [Clostridia bacterium]